MFNNKKKLRELIESKRYKDSNYQIQKVNGKYALNIKHTKNYVDLISRANEWNNTNYYFKDCIGSLNQAISAFNYKCPIIKTINIQETY